MSDRQLCGRIAPASCIRGPKLIQAALLLSITTALAACGGGGGGGGGGQSGPASTAPDPAPTLSFSASATSLTVGQSVTLNWQSSNADSCRASGGWAGDKGVTGSETVGPLQQSQTFSLSCSGSGGGALREVTVNVAENGDIDVSLASSADVVLLNDQVELSWSSSNADRCEASGDWSGDQELSGTYTTPPLTENVTYKLTCFAQGQSAVALVSVEVSNKAISWRAPTENVDGTPLDDLAGFNVYWGNSSRNYIDSVNLGPEARQWDVNLGSGTYFIAVTAIDSDSNESGYSTEIRRDIP